MEPSGYKSWIDAGLMHSSWLPEHFAPRFRRTEEILLARPQDYVRLGDIVQVTSSLTTSEGIPDWVIRRRGHRLALERPTSSEDITAKNYWIELPDECVVLDGMILNGVVAAMFWSKRASKGRAVTLRRNLVLVGRKHEDIAWLELALTDPIVVSQLEHASLVGVLPRITPNGLAEVRVPRLRPQETREMSERVRHALLKGLSVFAAPAAANLGIAAGFLGLPGGPAGLAIGALAGGAVAALLGSRSHKSGEPEATPVDSPAPLQQTAPILTAATFEQRLEQFERLLLEEQIAVPGTAFFCQASRPDHDSDLFVIRDIGSQDGAAHVDFSDSLHGLDEEPQNTRWRDWYWDASAGAAYAIYNSLIGGMELPTHILTRTVMHPRYLSPPSSRRLAIPPFADYRSAIEASRDWEDGLDITAVFETRDNDQGEPIATGELGQLWARLNPEIPPSASALDWLRAAFRPALAIRVIRQGRVAGVYLIFGADQIDDPGGAAAHLEVLGERLIAVLRQPSEVAQEAARSESLRRLSWFTHQLAGPLASIDAVVEDLAAFADDHEDIATSLLPDEERASRRAAMNQIPIDDYTLRNRLNKLETAVEEIRRLRYQIRRYKNAHGNLQLVQFDPGEMLARLATSAKDQLPELPLVPDPCNRMISRRNSFRYLPFSA